MVTRLGPLELVGAVPDWQVETLTVVVVNRGCEVVEGMTVLSIVFSKVLLSVGRVDVGLDDITSSEGTVTTFSVETCSKGTLDCERGAWWTDSVDTNRLGSMVSL